MHKVKQSDIADKLGISVSQVSRALSNKHGVRDEIRLKVREEAAGSGYRNFSGKHRKTALLVFQNDSEESLAKMNLLMQRLQRRKYRVICLFAENTGFLNQYIADRILAFDLPPGHPLFQRKDIFPVPFDFDKKRIIL